MSKKCSKTNICSTLADRLGDESGIVLWNFINIKTGKHTRTIIGYKLNRKDKGVVFNWCPWCGYELGKRASQWAEEGKRK